MTWCFSTLWLIVILWLAVSTGGAVGFLAAALFHSGSPR
jgi:hypothetical protein